MRMSGEALQACTEGCWLGPPAPVILGVGTDSRTLKKGEAFLALRGPRYDGHDYAAAALSRGAVLLIGDKIGARAWRHLRAPCLLVEDTLVALGQIAAARRRRLRAPVVAITGSFGKTTVRSMLAQALTRLGFKIAATRANDNNLIGVPQTLLAAPDDAQAVLVECGVSERGEMQRLGAIIRPDIAVITGLATAHTEGLGDLAGVVREKSVLLHHVSRGGKIVLGKGVAALLAAHGVHPGGQALEMDATGVDVVRGDLHDGRIRLEQRGVVVEVEVELPAPHWAEDMALAATTAQLLSGRTLADVGSALKGWHAAPGRLQRMRGGRGEIVIHDAYNANPASMAAALETLRRLPGRRFAVLGDMAELGDDAATQHARLDVSGLDGLILTGARMRALATRCGARWLPTVTAVIGAVRELDLHAGDHVLVKGSRCLRLERVVEAMTATTERCDAV